MKENKGFPKQTEAEGVRYTRPALQERLKELFKLKWKDTSDTHKNEIVQTLIKVIQTIK